MNARSLFCILHDTLFIISWRLVTKVETIMVWWLLVLFHHSLCRFLSANSGIAI